MKMIEVEKLNFEYVGKRVLRDMSFSIEEGSVTALVGPNGAGKTTLLRCLVALERPHSGKITMQGFDVADDPRRAHGMCGYLSDFFGLYDALSVRQSLIYGAWSHNVPADAIERRIQDVAAQTGITGMMDVLAGTLSRGYRQRLGIALALMHDPQLLILDEPASGMDPDARIALSRLMRDLRQRGKTIIVSSHILSELEDYCTDMLVIRDGMIADHVVLRDYVAANAAAARPVRIGIHGDAARALEVLKMQTTVSNAAPADGGLTCDFAGGPLDQAALLKALFDAGIAVLEFAPQGKRLQDAYMTVTHDVKGQ